MIKNLQNKLELLAHQTIKAGNVECGDSYFYKVTEDYFLCVLADGLGSGKYASESSEAVVDVVEQNHEKDLATLMELSNQSLYQKRGAAVSIVKVFFEKREFIYSGVGNIRFIFIAPDGEVIYPLPVSGYMSGKPQIFNTQNYRYKPGSKFLIYSDGFEIQGIKKLLNSFKSTQMIADKLRCDLDDGADDDATFILGSLL